jgi:hypothetical protein
MKSKAISLIRKRTLLVKIGILLLKLKMKKGDG